MIVGAADVDWVVSLVATVSDVTDFGSVVDFVVAIAVVESEVDSTVVEVVVTPFVVEVISTFSSDANCVVVVVFVAVEAQPLSIIKHSDKAIISVFFIFKPFIFFVYVVFLNN
jgi:hypothetical protein